MATLKANAITRPGELREWLISVADAEAQRVVKRLAEIAETSIKMWIMNTSKMPTGALASAFFKEQTGTYSWGVGKVSYLNENAPYWMHINAGSLSISANWDHKLPLGHWEEGRWIEGEGENNFFATPSTPIQAHNYIEKTIADIEIAIQKVISEK